MYSQNNDRRSFEHALRGMSRRLHLLVPSAGTVLRRGCHLNPRA
jgi:hypothetical protein